MNSKIFKSAYIKVEPNQEIVLEPIVPEGETRGAIHGTVKGAGGKVCIVELLKVIKGEGKNASIMPIAFQYPDDWGQFLFPIVDTDKDVRYLIKVACFDPEECFIDPVMGTEED